MKNLINKTIIGTAQLLDSYGISNFENQKKNKKKALNFLNYCLNSGFNNFDTAPGYGNELLLSKFFKNRKNIHITTKIPSIFKFHKKKKFLMIKNRIKTSYSRFGKNLKTVLFHDQRDVNFVLNNFNEIKRVFLYYNIKDFGFSIYDINKINYIKRKLKKNQISVQVPINYVDDRFLKIKYPKNIKVYGRSIFLQGLLINQKIKKKLNKKHFQIHKKYFDYIKNNSLNSYKICLTIIKNTKINKFIVGFDNTSQIKQFINNDNNYSCFNHKLRIKKFFLNSNIIDPRKW